MVLAGKISAGFKCGKAGSMHKWYSSRPENSFSETQFVYPVNVAVAIAAAYLLAAENQEMWPEPGFNSFGLVVVDLFQRQRFFYFYEQFVRRGFSSGKYLVPELVLLEVAHHYFFPRNGGGSGFLQLEIYQVF